MPLYRDRGVVVRTFKLGEADRIAVLVTRDNGKVRAVVKGARKTRSRLGARLEPLRHVDVQLNRGRGDLDVVTGAQTLDRWPHLRSDLDRLAKAMTLAEAADQAGLERRADPALYEMLRGALAELDRHDAALLVPAFLLKLLAHEGVAPQLDACVAGPGCDDDGRPVAVDAALGGVVCEEHRRGRTSSPATIGLLRAVLGGGLRAALDVPSSAETAEVAAVVNGLWEYQMERSLRSRDLLDH
ncbi:MAG TPA: DNA repair protein RecO [Acidimicrobiaceae bacterium]|nr:DNA repair protein RecO [Acidimicrobiaceae bacterium]HCB37615.1 DNA repair protein RecO [Acidimicrobiaceae bacterium]